MRGIRASAFALIASIALATPARGAPDSYPDSDGDGASNLVENAVGTDPGNPADNPAANGDLAFVLPYQTPPAPTAGDLEVASRLRSIDVYVILDRSGSMSAEITNVRSNLATALSNLSCPPLGTGDPATCIADLWAGAGTVGYAGSGADTFHHFVDVQPAPNFSALPTTEPSGCCQEPLVFSVFAAATGLGTASATGCGLSGVVSRATCAGSPAASGGFETFGYPCFRQVALPVVLLATDEPPLSPGDTNKCPNWQTVVLPQLLSRRTRLIGAYGSAPGAGTVADLQAMAMATGAVDAANGNEPLVFDASGANATTAIQTGIQTLASSVPLDLAALLTDDPSDAIDTEGAFVDRLETLQLGTPECADMLTAVDTNSDTFPDSYMGVRSGTAVCWRLLATPNEIIQEGETTQLFRADVRIVADGVTTLDTRDVFFVVPPVPEPATTTQLLAGTCALLALAERSKRRKIPPASAVG